MENEIWKDITGYEGKYQISNKGNVKSLDRIGKSYGTRVFNLKGNTLKKGLHKNGYLYIDLYKNGKNKKLLIHRLVGEAFLEKDNNRLHINHKDGNRDNNLVENLEWCTSSENHLHKYKVLGYKNHRMKQIKQFDLKGNFIKLWNSGTEIQNILGFKSSHISSCCTGRIKQSQGYNWQFA